MPELFEARQPGTEDQAESIAQLHQKIGQLTVDLDWLKKSPTNWDFDMLAGTGQSRFPSQRAASVRVVGAEPQQLLLPVCSGDGGESVPDAAVGRVAFEASGLWEPQADGAVAPGGIGGQPQAGGAVAGFDGDRDDLRQAPDEPAGARSPDLSVPVAGFGSHWARSSLAQRYHICADGNGFHVSGGGDGLVEPLCVGLAVEQHAGGGLLCGCLGSGVAGGTKGAADFQHRSRFDSYNQARPHQALGYATPAEVYLDPGAHGAQPATWDAMQPQSSRCRRKS